MLKPMWIRPACRKPEVTSRQYSPPLVRKRTRSPTPLPHSAPLSTIEPPPRSATPPPPPSVAMKAMTLTAISVYVTTGSEPMLRSVLTGVRSREHSGQRMPTDVGVMQSGQIGRAAVRARDARSRGRDGGSRWPWRGPRYCASARGSSRYYAGRAMDQRRARRVRAAAQRLGGHEDLLEPVTLVAGDATVACLDGHGNSRVRRDRRAARSTSATPGRRGRAAGLAGCARSGSARPESIRSDARSASCARIGHLRRDHTAAGARRHRCRRPQRRRRRSRREQRRPPRRARPWAAAQRARARGGGGARRRAVRARRRRRRAARPRPSTIAITRPFSCGGAAIGGTATGSASTIGWSAETSSWQ